VGGGGEDKVFGKKSSSIRPKSRPQGKKIELNRMAGDTAIRKAPNPHIKATQEKGEEGG